MCGAGVFRVRVPSVAGMRAGVGRVLGLCCMWRVSMLQRGHGVALVIMRVYD